MMHTPLCKDDNALNVCMYDMHTHDAYDSHPVTVLARLTPHETYNLERGHKVGTLVRLHRKGTAVSYVTHT